MIPFLGLNEPPEEGDDQGENDGEQGWPRPRKPFPRAGGVVHDAPPFTATPTDTPGTGGRWTGPHPWDRFGRMKFSRKHASDVVIFIGLAVNAVVIVLILYFYVF